MDVLIDKLSDRVYLYGGNTGVSAAVISKLSDPNNFTAGYTFGSNLPSQFRASTLVGTKNYRTGITFDSPRSFVVDNTSFNMTVVAGSGPDTSTAFDSTTKSLLATSASCVASTFATNSQSSAQSTSATLAVTEIALKSGSILPSSLVSDASLTTSLTQNLVLTAIDLKFGPRAAASTAFIVTSRATDLAANINHEFFVIVYAAVGASVLVCVALCFGLAFLRKRSRKRNYGARASQGEQSIELDGV